MSRANDPLLPGRGHVSDVQAGFGQCLRCGCGVERVGWDDLCFACQDLEEEETEGPADCPGAGIDDLCTWPDVESCGLCTLGKNPDLYGGPSGGR